jgi:transcriptional regulator with XRE-family HTH domain
MVNFKMIGNKIAEARKNINISQAQLAQRLFISSQAVGKWERGESMPDIITFNRLAEILGVDLNYFSEGLFPVSTELTTNEFSEKQTNDLSSSKQKINRSWDMSRGNWVDADFSGLKNLHEKFSSSNMLRCKFSGSEMSGILLKSNNVLACDFSGSDFSRSQIQNSNFSNNLFKHCSMKETEFLHTYITDCNFNGADFTGVIIKSGGFGKNTIVDAIWNCTSFIDSHIADVIFNGTLQDCTFENCSFTRLTFKNAIILNTFFKNKSLKKIQFIDCQADRITYEFLKNGKADLTGIKLLTPKGGNE